MAGYPYRNFNKSKVYYMTKKLMYHEGCPEIFSGGISVKLLNIA